MPLTPTNPRLLLLVKQVFLEGRRAATLGDQLSAMRATLLLDLAVEQALNLLLIDLPDDEAHPGRRDDVSWPELWQRASALSKRSGTLSRLPHHKQLHRLHEVRNLVQHQALIPEPSQVADYIAPVDGFLDAIFRSLYGVAFDTYTVADAIHNADLRTIIRESVYVLERGAPVLTTAAMIHAHSQVAFAVRAATEGTPTRLDRIVAWNSREQVGDVAQTLGIEIRALRADMAIASLGMSISDVGRFRELSAFLAVLESAGGWWQIQRLQDREDSEVLEGARFALSYVASVALLAQEAFPAALAALSIARTLRHQDVAASFGVDWTAFDAGQEMGQSAPQ